MFRKQLSDMFEENSLDLIEELGVYLALLYVQYWLFCASASDAPVQDLPLLTLFKNALNSNITSTYKDLVEACMKNMVAGHLGYLNERLVPLAFFSSFISVMQKNVRWPNKLFAIGPTRMEQSSLTVSARGN